MPVTAYANSQQSESRKVDLLRLLDSSSDATLDLQWEPFQGQVNAFLKAIDAYVINARSSIGDRVNEHTSSVRNYKAGKEEMERRINVERDNEAKMLSTVEEERHALSDLQGSLSHLQTSLQKIREQSAAVEHELNLVRKEANLERSEKDRQKSVLDEQKSKDGSELTVLEDGLGLKIEGVAKDVLLMRFTLVDPTEPDREFSMVVDISKDDYTVTKCEPMIPTLPDLLNQLNADRQFYSFIKRVRKAFRALVPEPAKPTSRFDDMAGPGLRTPGSRKVLESDLAGMRLE